jgi:hypothetical protein
MSIPNTPPIPCPNSNNYRGAGAVPKFRYVYFNQDTAKGEVQQWASSADGTTNLESRMGYAVEDVAVAASPHVAGVCAKAVDVSENPWGWIQTAGYCDYVLTDGSNDYPASGGLTGDGLIVATTSNEAIGITAAALNTASNHTDADTHTAASVFAVNLSADASTAGVMILTCGYQ